MKRLIVFLILLAFVLVSVPVMAATVSLTWVPPDVNCDGTNLNDLGGYIILWGNAQGGPYLNAHNVDDPSVVSTTINVGNIENATLYFVIVAVDLSGNRSDDVGGCGTSGEVYVPFGPISPAPPTSLTVVAVP